METLQKLLEKLNRMFKICFFCRSRLTELYGELFKHASSDFSYKYIAYSKDEEVFLKENYNIVVLSNFKKFVHQNFDKVQATNMSIIDEFIISWSAGRFNLNGVIQSDRALKHLSQSDAYKIIKIYWFFWDDFFKNNSDLDLFLHETTSLALNFLASLFCKKYEIIYTDMVGVPNYVPSFMFISSNNGESIDFENAIYGVSDINSEFNEYILQKYRSISNLSVDTSIVIAFKSLVKNFFIKTSNRFTRKIDSVKDCVEWFMLYDKRYKNKLINLFLYNFIDWDEPIEGEEFFYYSMNLEPEAVVQYLADGLYSNQVKLIENIAAQLPPNTYLYVKDHVVEYGYRNFRDYKYLQALHNVKVIDPRVRGSELIKKCKAVIAICGTAILEAHFFEKISYMFGNFYYEKSKNVVKIFNIKDFREILYSNPKFERNDKVEFLKKFLASSYLGSPDRFNGGESDSNVKDYADNIVNISNSLMNYASKNCKKNR
ncbi:hypothetical protein G3444_07380 [Shewanella baltica]|uniref:hypothetical protein n=1 Tax=Shewanella baltica TaxID=62322 RepID=UPI00217CE870|nr:hypothetical protein [Shewanella baltica]MCS6118733.1 hypothetical protein [Shewanella baltica]